MASTSPEHAAMTDWPTFAVVIGFWSSLTATVVAGDRLPSALLVAVLGVLGCLYMSLQHEVIHGHPSRWRRLNWAMVGLPLGLVLPFSRYRDTHLAHHNSDITDPGADPESFYVTAETWERAGRANRLVLRANRTLAGRLVLGPLMMAWRSLPADLARASREPRLRGTWLAHLAASAAVLAVIYNSSLPMWAYLIGFVYIGSSLTSLRSFAEHRFPADRADAPRSAIVRSGWFFSLLFLNNNLHYTHHQLPGAAWFRLPGLTDLLDSERTVADSAGTYQGYGSIVRRYLFRAFEQPVHPREVVRT